MATTLTRWDPFTELADLRSRFDRMFADPAVQSRAWAPAIDVVRAADKLTLRVDLPGMTAEDVTIEVDDGILTVSGRHQEDEEHEDGTYVRRERRVGSFSRSLALPAGTDADAIDATTRDGVLEVTIPLPEDDGGRRTITPKAG